MRRLKAQRRITCNNNLGNLGKAAQNHLTKYGFYPSGGWGSQWIGDPDQGAGVHQPGGWIYSLMPFLGEDVLHDVGQGRPQQQKMILTGGTAGQMSKFLSILHCPSRRLPKGGPCGVAPVNGPATMPKLVNKTDYAANGGTGKPFTEKGPGLDCLKTFPNCKWDHDDKWMDANFTGVVGLRTEIKKIANGISQTFFAGEKYLDSSSYYTGPDPSDSGSCMQGHDYGVIRFCSPDLLPMMDKSGVDVGSVRFGSAHVTGLNFVFCDGAVHFISYKIDPLVYTYLANRTNRKTFTVPF